MTRQHLQERADAWKLAAELLKRSATEGYAALGGTEATLADIDGSDALNDHRYVLLEIVPQMEAAARNLLREADARRLLRTHEQAPGT